MRTYRKRVIWFPRASIVHTGTWGIREADICARNAEIDSILPVNIEDWKTHVVSVHTRTCW
jgi:hypothetical protein